MTTPLHKRQPAVRPTAYVGGPMTNRPNFNFDAFDSLTNWLEYQQGWKVHNPHAHDQELYPGIDTAEATKVGDVAGIAAEVGFSFQGAMSWDLARVAESDHLVLLPEWETSTGAKAERFVAEMTGSQIWLANRTKEWVLDLPNDSKMQQVDCWYIVLDDRQKRLLAPELKVDLETKIQQRLSHALDLKQRGWREREPDTLAKDVDTFVKDVQAVRSLFEGVKGDGVVGVGFTPYETQATPWATVGAGAGLQPTPTPVIHYAGQFETKDSGERVAFDSGMVRDTQEGKPRFDLIPLMPLQRLAELYARGAVKYGDRNWQKANSADELQRFKASAWRHFVQFMQGDRDEDHGIAVVWNIFAALWLEEELSPVPSVMENDKA